MAWYAANGRHQLPWRQTRDAYAVLVSEVMLQQTQVARVLPYWERWMGRWPDVRSLADASPADVITAWAGLGYNRRALHLLRAAQSVAADHGGRLPAGEAELRRLPGIGPYTAAAVACFAFDARTPVADTNIARVLARWRLGIASPRASTAASIRDAASESLPQAGSARDHNLALMDLGALVCASRSPSCDVCPLRDACAWRLAGREAPERGTVAARPTPRFEDTARFARGRLVDALRSGPKPDDELHAALPAAHRKRAGEYLASLERDGLVARLEGGWTLPGATLRPAGEGA